MTTTFSSLKSSRVSSLDTLAKEMTKMQKSRSIDERFWRCETDKAGNGSAVIRFLPASDETVPFVRLWHHAFKGPGGAWYFENSLTTLNQQDPVSELNSKLWAQGDKGKAVARVQKRKLKYIANIYIVKDPAHPENEGKVYLFSFGKKIFDKLNEKMTPQFEDEVAMNPFDMWNGANFKLRICKKDDFTNYDNSTFDITGPLNKEDAELEAVWKQTYKLQPFVAADQFKPYSELKNRLERVLAMPTTDTQASAGSESGGGVAHQPEVPSSEIPAGTVKNHDFFQRLADEDE